jgi:hypothetical protein
MVRARFVVTVVVSIVATLSCHQGVGPAVGSNARASSDYCRMAAAILDEVVKTADEQPFGLERACVEDRAESGAHIYVDARFNRKVDHAAVATPDCASGKFLIRFNRDSFVSAPSPGVVLLLVYDGEKGSGIEFSARTENSDWPKNKPGVMSLSACGSAFGVLSEQGNRWRATVTSPQPTDAK